jgi:hypothetical protein
MNSLNITDFPGNAFATAKALRQSALKWQLLALSAQAKAIEAIAQEHHISLKEIQFESLVQQTEDLVKTATTLSMEAESLTTVESLRRIVALRTGTEQLRQDAARFVVIADQRAHFRLSSLLPVLFEQSGDDPLRADETKENKHLEPDADHLAAGAGARCYRAESEQHGTFALQVNSICDLAMEMVMAAAADHAPARNATEV